MSRTIDSRVVEMRFDNKQFESNVKTSMSTLDKLKQSLNLDGASKGLENINTAAKNVNMSGLSGAVETVGLKFSALQVVAVTALSNITTSVMRASSSLLKNTIGAIAEGGKRRALNIEQAKFQFKGLGMDVEATMADASYAVDGTAYSLDAAAKVASQLGASGMRAGDDMRKSLRAISGVAAMAGSSYEDIGNVFTKVAGQGRLMGDDLLRLSSRGINAAATIAKALNKTEAEVRDMVTKGKVDFQMFADAMDSAFGEHATAANETFTGSLSNVKAALARIGENIYGPLHENMIGPLNELRLKINEVAKILEPTFAKLAILMEKAGKKATEMLKNLDLTEMINKIKMGDKTADKLRRTFSGVFALLDIAKEFFGAIFRGAGDVLSVMSPLGDGLLDVTARFGDFIVGVRNAIKETGFFDVAINGIVTILTDLRDFLIKIGNGIKNAITKIGQNFQGFGSIDLGPLNIFSKAVEIAMHPFTSIAKLFQKAWEMIVKVIEWARPYVEKAAKAIGPALKTLFGAFGEAFRSGDLKRFMELVNTGLLGTVIVGIKKFIDSLKNVGENASGMLEGIKSVLDGVCGSLEAYQKKLKAQTLLTIAIAVGVLAASLWVLSGIPADKMLPAIGALTTLVAELAATMVIMGKAFKSFKGGTQILLFAAAILILANALKSLAELNPDQLQIGLTGVTALIVELTAAAMVMSKSSSKMIKGGVGLIAMATAILILAQAVKSLSTLDPGQLATGLIGVGVLLAEIAGFTQIVKPEKLISTGLGMIAMATALNIMSGAVTTLSSIDPLNLTQGLIALGVILAEIAGFTHIVNPKKLISIGVAMIAMGAALKIISSAVKTFGEMDLAQLAQGLIAMGIALAEIAGFTQIVKPEKMLSTGVALIAVGTALLLIAKAVQSFGGMSWKEMAKGLVMLGGSLLIITVALNAMKGLSAEQQQCLFSPPLLI